MVNMGQSDAVNFIGCKEGDIFTYTYNNKPAVVKITKLGEADRFVLTADINKKVDASELTRNNIVKSVDQFVKAAGSDVETFNTAANESNYQVLVTTANRNDYTPMMNRERGVRNIPTTGFRKGPTRQRLQKISARKSLRVPNLQGVRKDVANFNIFNFPTAFY